MQELLISKRSKKVRAFILRLVSSYHSLAVLFLFCAWCGLYLPSLGQLGLYHDEWAAYQDFSSLQFLQLINNPRIVGSAIFFIFGKITGLSPLATHIASRLAFFASAFSFYLAGFRAFSQVTTERADARLSAFFCALIWLCVPWMHGVVLWAGAFPTLIALSFYFLSVQYLFTLPSSHRSRSLTWLFYLLALLSYQAFWFAIWPFVLMLISIKPKAWREHVRIALGLFGIETLSVLLTVFYQISSTVPQASKKTVNSHFFETYFYQFRRIPEVLFVPFEDAQIHFLKSAAPFLKALDFSIFAKGKGGLSICLVIILLGVWRKRAAPLLICFLGVPPAFGIFMLAGYGPASSGVFSRTTVVLSIWAAFGFGSLILITASTKRAWLHMATITCGCLVTLSFAIANISETEKWQRSWALQVDLLKQFPVAQAMKISPSGILVISFRKISHASEVFGAYWDISAALAVTFPQLRTHFVSKDFATVAQTEDWQTDWDGKKLKQKWCNTPVDQLNWTLNATAVGLWDYNAHSFEVYDVPPLALGCRKKNSAM